MLQSMGLLTVRQDLVTEQNNKTTKQIMEEVSFFRLLNCFQLPLLHIVTDDVTALPSLRQWFPITLRIPSKLSPWPNMSPDLISLSRSSHRGHLAISGAHQACSFFGDFTLVLCSAWHMLSPTGPHSSLSHDRQVSAEMCPLEGSPFPSLQPSTPMEKSILITLSLTVPWFCRALMTNGLSLVCFPTIIKAL